MGGGGTAATVKDTVDAINAEEPTWNVVGILDDNKELHGKYVSGMKILGSLDIAFQYSNCFFISSIAHPTNRYVRQNVHDRVVAQGCKFATLIHPTAIISNTATIGEGCYIDSFCNISGLTKIEDDVFILSFCSVGHESKIKQHTTMSVGARVSGDVVVGESCYLGTNCSTSHNVTICDNILVAMGSAVTNSIKKGSTWIGVPAIPAERMARLQYFIKCLIKKDI